MRVPDISTRDLLSALGYAALGVLGTGVAAVGLVYVLQPLQPVVYDALYLVVGPWTATEAASIFHIGVAGVLAVSVPTVTAELLDGQRTAALALGFVALVAALVAVLVAAALLGVLGFLTLLVAYALLVAAALGALAASDAATGTLTAFVGGVPVLALLLFLLAFGLGWGGGYDVVAERLQGHDATDDVADFDDAPQVRDDLFAEQSCDPYEDGVCRLSLRGYEHELRAARFLDAHGVRCPFLNQPSMPVYDRDASFVAEHAGDYYRVSCEAYGD
ncbi:MAG: hypothetical protein ABEH83_08520 [Halobacterium sp.]